MRRILGTTLTIALLSALAACAGGSNGTENTQPTTTIAQPRATMPTAFPTRVRTVVKIKKVPVIKRVTRTIIRTRTIVKIKRVVVIKYVSRSNHREAPATHTPPGGVAACIRKYESGGDYRAQNPSSTASGAYQFLDTTWQAVTGLPGRAKDYSPATQDSAFYKLWNDGAGRSQWVTEFHC